MTAAARSGFPPPAAACSACSLRAHDFVRAGLRRILVRRIQRRRDLAQRARQRRPHSMCSAGAEPGDPFVVARPAEPYAQAMPRDPGRLRIGFTAASPIGTEVHPEAKPRWARPQNCCAASATRSRKPRPDRWRCAREGLPAYLFRPGRLPWWRRRARTVRARADFELLTRVLATLGGAISAGALTAQLLKWNEFARGLARFHPRYDMMLTPTLAHPPIRQARAIRRPQSRRCWTCSIGRGLLGLLARAGLLDGTVDKMRATACNMCHSPSSPT